MHPPNLAFMGLIIYGYLWISSYLLAAFKLDNWIVNPSQIEAHNSADVWDTLSIAATLAIAAQVLAGAIRFDEKNIKNQQTLQVHAEKYLSLIPVLIAVASSLPIYSFLFDYATSYEESRDGPNLFDVFLATAIGWVILALCTDAQNKFSGNLALEKVRVQLTRRRCMRDIRFMHINRFPKPNTTRSLSNIIESLFIEILLTFLAISIIILAVYTFRHPDGRSAYLTEYFFELIHALLPNFIVAGTIYWLSTSIFTVLFIHIRFADYVFKFYWGMLLLLYIVVITIASLENWGVLIVFLPPLVLGYLLQKSKPTQNGRKWLIPWKIFPGSFARFITHKYLWKNHEKTILKLKRCELKLQQYRLGNISP